MDQMLQHFRAEPFWFTIKAISAAVSLICLQQTGFLSSGLVPYRGSFYPHTPPKPPPAPAPLVFKMTVDPLKPHPDYSNVQGIYTVVNDTSQIVAYQQANVSGLIVDMMVMANASDHCFSAKGTAAEGANTPFLPRRMMIWLISTGTNLLDFILRRLADVAFVHNSAMSTASMASIATPLTVIAAFVGHRGYLGIKHVRSIYRANAKLARTVRDREDQIVTLDEAVLLNINRVALLEGISTRTDEAKAELQQQYANASKLKDTADKEARIARHEATTARKALEKTAKALATAGEAAQYAKEETKAVERKATEDAKEADKKITGANDVVNEQRNTITSLRRDKCGLERDLQQARTEATATAEKSKKSLSQKEAENLRGELRDKDQLLKSQGQNTINLQKKMNSLKEQIQNSKPEAVDKLRKQITDEQQLHKVAVAEVEMTEKIEAEKRQMSAEVEAKNDLRKQVEEAAKSLEAAEHKVALLEAEKAQQAEIGAEDMRTLNIQIEESINYLKGAEAKSDLLEAEMETRAEATRQLEEKLTASNSLLMELKGEMEELDTDFHTSVARFRVVQAAKDATIKELEAQIGHLRSTPSWTDDEVSTSSEGLNEQPQRPAVRLPASKHDSATTENANTDDRDAGNPIKDGPNGSSTNLQESGGEAVVNHGQNDLSKRSSPVAKICFCDNCGRNHAPPCKYMGPPYCANCGNDHTGKLHNCKKWCKQCQASHYRSDCPHTKTAPPTSSQAPTGSAAVDTSNDLGNPPASSPAPPDDQGNQAPLRLPATTPVPAIDASRILAPQRGAYGAHRYTAPGLAPIRPSPGGFVPIPAAQRHGPSSGRGRGRGRPGQDAPLSAAESFQRQQRGRGS